MARKRKSSSTKPVAPTRKNLTKAEQLAKTPIENVMTGYPAGEAGRKMLLKDVQLLSRSYNRRVAQFKRKGLDSYAKIKYDESLPDTERKPLEEMTRNQLILEFARYSRFFNSLTSFERGIRYVNREQDKLIFGKDRRGNPLANMSGEERKNYWKVYDEFKRQELGTFARFQSGAVQNFLGRLQVAGKIPDFDEEGSLTTALKRIADEMEAEEEEREYEELEREVFSSEGNL